MSRMLKWVAIGASAWWLGRASLAYLRRYDFRGKTVLVTGGSRGLGLLLARRLVEAGARVAICAIDGTEVQRARDELLKRGGNVIGLSCDVTDREAVERLVRDIHDAWGGVDVLINNAGVIQVGPSEDMTLADYEQAMNVHFWGPLYAMLAVLPEMRRRTTGRIINIASIGGLISVPHLLPYCASKFALVGLSQGMRADLLADGIYVTTVCPGLMRTGSHGHAQFKGRHQAEYTWFSLTGSAPILSMSADRAADEILRACRAGRGHVVLSLPAKFGSMVHGVAPGLTADTLGLVDQLLPGPSGSDQGSASGFESRPGWLPSFLTRLNDKAAARNNEIPMS